MRYMANMLAQELGAEKQWSLASHLRSNPPWRVATAAERNPHSTLFDSWYDGGQFCGTPAAITVWVFLDVSLIDRPWLLLHSTASQVCNIYRPRSYRTPLLTLSTHLNLRLNSFDDDIFFNKLSERAHYMSGLFDLGRFVYHPFDYYCGSNPKVIQNHLQLNLHRCSVCITLEPSQY